MVAELSKNMKLGLLLGIFLLGGCNPFGGSSHKVIDIAGNWQFVGTSSKFGDQYTANGTIAQNGASLTGTFNITGDPCATEASAIGTISGTSLKIVFTENGQSVTFTGTVNTAGTSASGSYTAAAGGCVNGDTGTWAGTKQ